MLDARETAAAVLQACRREGAWSDGRLKTEIRKNGLDKRDAALAAQLCFGVLQNEALLDYYISKYCPRKLEPKLRDILRLGAYQILFLDRVPDRAAVDEAVKAAKKQVPRASGLVNAVLRAISSDKNSLLEPPDLETKYSHPKWLVDEFTERLGREGCEEWLRANNSPAPITVIANTLRTDPEGLLKSLRSDGVEALPIKSFPGAFEIRGAGDITELSAWKDGLMLVQDIAARLSVEAAAPGPGETVIDCCAAPGGKSFSASMLMGNCGKIIAMDIHEHKLKLIEAGAKRLGVNIISTVLCDAREPGPELTDSADLVIADVPCSGFGTIRKKPDVRYKKREDVARLPGIQLEILSSISKCVKKGGRLLYSTCTLRKSENEDVAGRFLDLNPQFELIQMRTLWPQIDGTDGFFICLMKRKDFAYG
jgi:16S rRNA (cytosine967-C5)-methyltransferase